MKKLKVGLILDSSAGFYDGLVDQTTKQVHFGIADSTGKFYLDNNIDITAAKIIQSFDNDITFQTSAVTPGAVIQQVENLLETCEKVLVLTVSSALSSYYQNILFLKEEYNDQIEIIDTKEIGYPIYYIAQQIKQMIKEEKSIDELIKFASEFNSYNCTSFTCENWSSLIKNGRAPKALGKMFNFLKTKPVIKFQVKNKLHSIATNFENAVEKMLKRITDVFGQFKESEVNYFVFYNNFLADQKANYIRQKIKSFLKISTDKIIESMSPNLVLVYTGKGSFGFSISLKKEILNPNK